MDDPAMNPALDDARKALADYERKLSRCWQVAAYKGLDQSVTNFLTEAEASDLVARLTQAGMTIDHHRPIPNDTREGESLRTALAAHDRVARILACERGEWAPEGWKWAGTFWTKDHDRVRVAKIEPHPNGYAYSLGSWCAERFTYALEAIEAAALASATTSDPAARAALQAVVSAEVARTLGPPGESDRPAGWTPPAGAAPQVVGGVDFLDAAIAAAARGEPIHTEVVVNGVRVHPGNAYAPVVAGDTVRRRAEIP